MIDTLGLDADRRNTWREAARKAGLPCVAVAFDVDADEARRRNRERDKRIPAEALTSQLRSWRSVRDALDGEGFDQVLKPEPVRVVAKPFVNAVAAAELQRIDPTALRFGLHLTEFKFPGSTADSIRDIAHAAEAAGFDAIYVMDHFRQIPLIGRPWEDFLESYTTLAYLAAHTERVRLGALVTGVTYRNVGHLAKIVATLDVLSGGRAVCGLGLGWWKEEHEAYGWAFPPVSERYALLEDALQALPQLWGPGAKPFVGQRLNLPETACYPRPLQERVPIIVGGSGERTLRLAAKYADAANVFGDAANVRAKADFLRKHSESIELTHLSTTLIADNQTDLSDAIERLRPRRWSTGRFAASVNAGTVDDHIGRFRELADAGAAEVIVRLPNLTDPTPIERISRVIRSFR